MSRSFAMAAVALVASLETGCGSQCDRHPDEPPVVFKDGTTDQASHSYISSSNAKNPWAGPWLDFPPGRTYRFPHGLGGVPRDVKYWFAFGTNPIADNGSGQTGGFVLGSGNQGTIQDVTADHVDIRNDTCSDVFLMVRIADPDLRDAGVSADAGEGGVP
jgi:hypothetical protein